MRESTPGVGIPQPATQREAAAVPTEPRRAALHAPRAVRRAYLRLLDLLVAGRSQRLVDDLDLPEDASISDLRDLLEERRGRRVRVWYVDRERVRDATGKRHVSAAWLEGEDEDLLLVDAAAWSTGRDDNLRHEFAHMLLGHTCELGMDEHLTQINDATARSILEGRLLPSLARGEWTSPRERHTELVATMLGRRLRSSKTSAPRTVPSVADARARHMLGIVDDQDGRDDRDAQDDRGAQDRSPKRVEVRR